MNKLKLCKACGVVFSGRGKTCSRECKNLYRRMLAALFGEHIKTRQGIYYQMNKDRLNEIRLKKLHGLDELPRKPKACESCGEDRPLQFDHDHSTGQFRGWICLNCNRAIGLAKDNPETLHRMARYLEPR